MPSAGASSSRRPSGVNLPPMSELVADCPRCGSNRITFDLLIGIPTEVRHSWQVWYEAFCVCRHCRRATIFVLSDNTIDDSKQIKKIGLANVDGAVNNYVRIEHYISLKDRATVPAPEHTPKNLQPVFREGATCLAVGCFNAAGTMFRLCVDLATRPLLPEGEVPGLSAKTRRDLGLQVALVIRQWPSA